MGLFQGVGLPFQSESAPVQMVTAPGVPSTGGSVDTLDPDGSPTPQLQDMPHQRRRIEVGVRVFEDLPG